MSPPKNDDYETKMNNDKSLIQQAKDVIGFGDTQNTKDDAGVDRSQVQKAKDAIGIDKSKAQEAKDKVGKDRSVMQKVKDAMP